ncbi:uncharacterized protein [Panulirus ornatus]|uniref:uncharacterized protein isoform X8 n=1 Tax=Panulirus ornatus TaxID=150431 RepID=UPI003A892A24
MADIFTIGDARHLLKKKFVLMLGDSNMRSIYRDLIYLLAEGGITPAHFFRKGGERKQSYCGDTVVDISKHDTAGRNYFEIREYKDEDLMVRFHFITRVYSQAVQQELSAIEDGLVPIPHVVIINSCLWDITRWGAMREDNYKEEMVDLFQHLRRSLPDDTLIMWTSTLPVATERIKGGVIIKQGEILLDKKILQYLQEKSCGKGPRKKTRTSCRGLMTDQMQKPEPKNRLSKRVKVRAHDRRTQGVRRAPRIGRKKNNVKEMLVNGNNKVDSAGGYHQLHPPSCTGTSGGISTSWTGKLDKTANREILDINWKTNGSSLKASTTEEGRDLNNRFVRDVARHFSNWDTKDLSAQENLSIQTNTGHCNIINSSSTSHYSDTYSHYSDKYSREYGKAVAHSTTYVNPNVAFQEHMYRQSYQQFNTHIPYPFWHNYPTSHFPWNRRM